VKTNLFCLFIFCYGSLLSQNPSSFTWNANDPASACVEFNCTNSTQATYTWTFDTTGNQSNLEDPYFRFSDTGCYEVTLRVEDAFGVADSTTQTVCIHNESVLFMPNAFTPNGDAINDVFFVYGYLIREEKFEMRVYDNWGALVYSSYDIHQGWDGTHDYRGENYVQMGAYLLELIWYDVHDVRHSYRGAIMVLMR
jgi:gliding motility-associated-like protein